MASLGSIFAGIPERSAPAAARVAALAARQHGVASRSQLLAAGLPSSLIGDWLAAGHLHRIHRGVYAVGHPIVTREGRLLAAVLACGPGAALSHGSAALHWGLQRDGEGPVHLSVPRSRRSSPEGIVVHRPRRLDRLDLTRRTGIPATTATRTLFDQAAHLGPRALRDQFDRAEYLRLLDRARLGRLLDGACGRRGLGTLRMLFAERPVPLGETRSILERIVLRICRDRGVPIPAANVPLLGYEVDFLWPEARFVVEADGGQHRGPQRDRDNRRDARLGRAGFLVRRYSGAALADEHGVGAEIEEIVASRLAARP